MGSMGSWPPELVLASPPLLEVSAAAGKGCSEGTPSFGSSCTLAGHVVRHSKQGSDNFDGNISPVPERMCCKLVELTRLCLQGVDGGV